MPVTKETIRVEVVYGAAPRDTDACEVELTAGATLLDALVASGVLQRHPSIDLERHGAGVWGRPRPLDAPLCDGDRVEVYRGLQADPKDARRARAAAARGRVRRYLQSEEMMPRTRRASSAR